ncbi:hypothetical protein [Streptomyces abyssomicinicus]|uniref:hypothetical protein n=1 Tax=Streptomyces abyssomicinicus TaxID=574929 RepID=UPI0013DF910D|nr:hypothetical protein [Streptomyces abyssomicinicus]
MLDVSVTTAAGREAVVHAESLTPPAAALDDALQAELFDFLLERFRASAARPDRRHCPTLLTACPDPVLSVEDDGWIWADAAVVCTEPDCIARARAYEARFAHSNAPRLRRSVAQDPPEEHR